MSVAPHEPQNRCSVPLSTPQDGQMTTSSISMGVYVRPVPQVVPRRMTSRCERIEGDPSDLLASRERLSPWMARRCNDTSV